jgi:hypothetical protein
MRDTPFLSFFDQKLQYLSVGLHKGRLSYRGSLQSITEKIQHLKKLNLLIFLYVDFALLDPDADSAFRDRGPH